MHPCNAGGRNGIQQGATGSCQLLAISNHPPISPLSKVHRFLNIFFVHVIALPLEEYRRALQALGIMEEESEEYVVQHSMFIL